MEEEGKEIRRAKGVAKTAEGYVKGMQGWKDVGGKNYRIYFPKRTSTAAIIKDTSSKASQIARAKSNLATLMKQAQSSNLAMAQKAAAKLPAARKAVKAASSGPARGSNVLRLDTPHRGHMYNHININPDISLKSDPHIKISSFSLEAGTGAAKLAKVLDKVNKVLTPVAIAIDTIRVGRAAYDDYNSKTSRNTVETLGSIGGSWGGGYGGASLGAAIGTACCPGIGTIAGGMIGGLVGGIGGSFGASYAIEYGGDKAGYDVYETECEECGVIFYVRLYKGEKDRKFCDECA